MKILFLNSYDDASDGGGAEITMWTLIQALTEQGHQCVVLATHKGSGLRRTYRDGINIWRAGIRNIYWPTKDRCSSSITKLSWHLIDAYSPLMQRHLKKVLRHELPDVVSVHNLPGWSAYSWKTLKEGGYPFVQVLHDQYAICARTSMFRGGHNCAKQCIDCRLLRLPHRRWSNRPSAVVGVSKFILDWHQAQGYFKDVPIKHAIANTRNAGQLDLSQPPETHDGIRFGFIGKIDPTKGIELLLSAFSRLGRADAELWIAGSGDASYIDDLKRRTTDHRVRFLGRVFQRHFYPRIDVVVVPSLWQEPLGMVVAEALAYGRPVIGSSRGGIPEMIVNGETGFLFDPDSPNQLELLLEKISADSSLRRRMSAAALGAAEPFPDTHTWAAKYTGIYEKISRSST